MDGIVNVNKPLGMTSHDVVSRLRRILNIKKIGHTGTLDPDAKGVLPMCIGKGTKLSEELSAKEKQYLAEITFGITTATQDISGEVLTRSEMPVSKEEAEAAILSFIGEIEQIPPMYSAIKIGGKKLYELAREGKTVEREPRRVTIFDIKIEEIDEENRKARFLVDCSKGTYIRTLCNDIGEKLGCGAVMSALTRTKSGSFALKDAYTLEKIEEMALCGDFSFLTPIDKVLSRYERVVLAEKNSKRLCNGIPVRLAGVKSGTVFRAYDESGRFLALCQKEEEAVKVIRAFYGEASK